MNPVLRSALTGAAVVLFVGRASAGDAPAHAAAMVEAARQVMDQHYPHGVGAPLVNGEPTTGTFTLPDLVGYTGLSASADDAHCWSCGLGGGCSTRCMLGKAINAPDAWDCLDSGQPPLLTQLNANFSTSDVVLADNLGFGNDHAAMACNYTHFSSNPALGEQYSAHNAFEITDAWASEIITGIEAHSQQCSQATFTQYVERVVNSLHYIQDQSTEHHELGNKSCGINEFTPSRIAAGGLTRLESFARCMAKEQGDVPVVCDDEVSLDRSWPTSFLDHFFGSVPVAISGVSAACDARSPLACLGLERLIRHHCSIDDNKTLLCGGPPSDHQGTQQLENGKPKTYCEGERFAGGGEDYLTAAVAASVGPFYRALERWAKVCKEPDVGPCDAEQCQLWCENQSLDSAGGNPQQGVCTPTGGRVVPGDNPSSVTVVLGEGNDTVCECRPASDSSDAGASAPADAGLDAGSDGGSGDAGNDTPPEPPPPANRDGIPAAPADEGDAARDPHLLTFDGLKYDMQGVGEFTLALDTSDGLEVQSRTAPYGVSTVAAVNVAVAVRVGSDRVTYDVAGTLKINGIESDQASARIALPGGAELYNPGWGIVLVYPDNAQVAVANNGGFLSVSVNLPVARANGALQGLLGNFNAELADELLTRDGMQLTSPVEFGAFYNVFVESWRIAQADSLFDYAEDETTETFTDRSFPRRFVRTQDLDENAIVEATLVCEDAGISDPDWLDACIFDVAATGDATFAIDYLQPVPPKSTLEVLPPKWPGVEDPSGQDGEGSNGGAKNGGGLGAARDATGTLAAGEHHVFSFAAGAGNGIQLRLVDPAASSFVPKLDVYDAEGTLVASNYGNDVAYISLASATAGVFTVVVSDASRAAPGGDYNLYFARAPGSNEGGLLESGTVTPGQIDLGDLDSFTFTAEAGEGVQLRLADIAGSNFVPALQVYNPDGSNAGFNYTTDVAYLSFAASQSGTYTVLAFDWSSGAAAAGEYKLYYAKAKGETSNGALSSGTVSPGTIEKGELDSFTFSAEVGEGVQLRLADLEGGAFVPALQVYNPDGSSAGFNYTTNVAYLSFIASQSGIYTVMAFDWSSGAAASGDYNLYYAKANAETSHGALSSGAVVAGSIEKGELDSFTLVAEAGEGVQLRLADLEGGDFVPALQIYNPDGSSAGFNYTTNVAYLSFVASQSGIYTLMAFDWSSGAASAGDYNLYYAKANGETSDGALSSGAVVAGSIDKGELDSFTFSTSLGATVSLDLTDVAGGSFVPALQVYKPDGSSAVFTYAADVASVSLIAPQAGIYTVIAFDWSSGAAASGEYELALTLQ